MIKIKTFGGAQEARPQTPYIGTLGRLAILIWSLTLLFFAPQNRLILAALLPLLLNITLYPSAVKRLLRWRWLFFALLLILPTMLWSDEPDRLFLSIPYASSGLHDGLPMALRALIVILALDGFSSAVDIAAVAGLLQRVGLPGLGFSLGVAINLLPALRKSSQNTWRSLQMRGGFRRQWWQGMQFLLITVVANALRRAEEIALAAEVRAFSPEKARPLPLQRGKLDPIITIVLLASWLFLSWRIL
jgi:energy-coupling factor transporter transmembrane protein EcfT